MRKVRAYLIFLAVFYIGDETADAPDYHVGQLESVRSSVKRIGMTYRTHPNPFAWANVPDKPLNVPPRTAWG